MLKKITCPLCNSGQSVPLKSFIANEMINAWKDAYEIDIKVEFQNYKTVYLKRCKICKLEYFEPREIVGSGILYEKLAKFSWYYMKSKWEYEQALSLLNSNNRVIEIGCGVGDFIAIVGKAKELKIEGIDLNKSAVLTAQSRGLPVYESLLEEIAARNRSQYDAVCAFQVLEHLSKPKEFLQLACELLKGGGKLILGLPNANSYLKYQFNLLNLPPHHITRWSSEVLMNVPKFFPLELKKIYFEPLATYHVGAYISTYISLLKRFGMTHRLLSKLKKSAENFITVSVIRRLIKGHSLLVEYIRV